MTPFGVQPTGPMMHKLVPSRGHNIITEAKLIEYERQRQADVKAERARQQAEAARAEMRRREILRRRKRACYRLYVRAGMLPPEDDDGGKITMRQIIRETADKHDIPVIDILSKRRHVRIVAARHEAMWRCRMETINSYPQIGRAFGGRDHTTAINAVRRHQARLEAARLLETEQGVLTAPCAPLGIR